MPQPTLIRTEVWEGGNVNLMSRVLGLDNNPIFQAGVTGGASGVISVDVYDMSSATPDTAVYSTTLTCSAVIFTTLQTDSYWTRDGEGYCFRHMMSASNFTMNGGKKYRVCYRIPSVSFGTIPVPAEVQCKSLLHT